MTHGLAVGASRVTRTFDITAMVGKSVRGISFVHDYVEVLFHGATLRLLAPWELMVGNDVHRSPSAGAKLALLKLIGAGVSGATEDAGEALVLQFGGPSGGELRVSLNPEHRQGPEAAHYCDDEIDGMAVW